MIAVDAAVTRSGVSTWQDWRKTVDNRSFREGLGRKLDAERDTPKANGKRAAIALGAAIALLAVAGILAVKVWIGG